MTKRALGLLVSAVTTLALCLACGTAGSGGGDGGVTGGTGGGGTGGTSGAGTGGTAGSGATGGATGGTTPCGATTCPPDQVCAQQGCGGMPPPDGGSCTPPAPKCVALPTACNSNPSCSCFDSIWTTLGCGTITYGTIQCPRPCA